MNYAYQSRIFSAVVAVVFTISFAGDAYGENYRRGKIDLMEDSTELNGNTQTSAVKIFSTIDTDEDFLITRDELRIKNRHLKKKIDSLIVLADTNQDGKISYSEFFDIKNKFLEDFSFTEENVKSQIVPEGNWAFFENYGLFLGLLGMALLLACFKFI